MTDVCSLKFCQTNHFVRKHFFSRIWSDCRISTPFLFHLILICKSAADVCLFLLLGGGVLCCVVQNTDSKASKNKNVLNWSVNIKIQLKKSDTNKRPLDTVRFYSCRKQTPTNPKRGKPCCLLNELKYLPFNYVFFALLQIMSEENREREGKERMAPPRR